MLICQYYGMLEATDHRLPEIHAARRGYSFPARSVKFMHLRQKKWVAQAQNEATQSDTQIDFPLGNAPSPLKGGRFSEENLSDSPLKLRKSQKMAFYYIVASVQTLEFWTTNTFLLGVFAIFHSKRGIYDTLRGQTFVFFFDVKRGLFRIWSPPFFMKSHR